MQTIDRITDMLDLLSQYKDGLMISEISQALSLPISTTHRMLNALKRKGYIAQDKMTKRYKLGIGILTLAVSVMNNTDIVEIARPYMEELSSMYQKLVFLSVMENEKVICVSMVNKSNKMKFFVQIGSEMPIHCSVSAQTVFAYRSEAEIDKVLEGKTFTKLTDYTLTEAEQIKRKMASIREKGYGICDEEMELGVKAISAPIRDRNAQVTSSITIIGIKHNDVYDEEVKMIQDLTKTAMQISKALGYLG